MSRSSTTTSDTNRNSKRHKSNDDNGNNQTRTYDRNSNNNNKNDNRNNNDDDNYQRPRRPNDDTIAYLVSLPLDLHVATQEITLFLQYEKSKINNNEQQQVDEEEFTNNNNNNNIIEIPQSFVACWTALQELQNDIASLACCSINDEQVSESLEIMIRTTAPYSQLISKFWLSTCINYYIFLSTHRYGSHVIQTILQCCCCYSNNSNGLLPTDTYDLALHDDINSTIDNSLVTELQSVTITDLLVRICNEMKHRIPELVIHLCGSHVIRALVCALGNVEIVSTGTTSTSSSNAMTLTTTDTRRGKTKNNKKKKKSKPSNDDSTMGSNNSNSTIRLLYQQSSRIDNNNEQVHDMLKEIATIITNDIDTVRYDLIKHSSACPLIIMLLQVLTYNEKQHNNYNTIKNTNNSSDWPTKLRQWEYHIQVSPDKHLGLTRPEPTFTINSSAYTIVQRLFNWSSSTSNTNLIGTTDNEIETTYQLFYDLSSDIRGSRIIETILKHSPDTIYDKLITVSKVMTDSTILQQYLEHNIRNYIIQMILVTIRTNEQMVQIITLLVPFIENGYLLTKSNNRRGIVWRMVELVVLSSYKNYNDTYTIQSKIINSIRVGITKLDTNDTTSSKSLSFSEILLKLMNIQKDSNSTSTTTNDNINNDNTDNKVIANNQYPNKSRAGAGGIVVDVAMTRAIYWILQFDCTLLEDTNVGNIRKFITSFQPDELELLITDTLSSRCIIDRIIENCSSTAKNNNTKVWTKLVRQIVIQLKGRWTTLSIHRVGYHTVRKIFHVVDNKDKEIIVQELIGSTNNTTNINHRLTSNSMGRTIRNELAIHEYQTNGIQDWIRQINQNKQNQETEQKTNDNNTTTSTTRKSIPNIVSFLLSMSSSSSNSSSLMMMSSNIHDTSKNSNSISISNDSSTNDSNTKKLDDDAINSNMLKKDKKKRKKKDAIDSIFDPVS